jgi:hypothetical protein
LDHLLMVLTRLGARVELNIKVRTMKARKKVAA